MHFEDEGLEGRYDREQLPELRAEAEHEIPRLEEDQGERDQEIVGKVRRQ